MSHVPVVGNAAPVIFCPFPLRELKPVESYINASAFWLEEHHLVATRRHAVGLANVGAHYIQCCYPHVDPAHAQDLTHFCAWNCLLDDYVESGPLSADLPRLVSFLSAIGYLSEESNSLGTGLLEDCAMSRALIDLKLRLQHWTTPSQLRQLMKTLRHFTAGLGWEAALRCSAGTPDLNTFCAMKTANAGMFMANAMAECANNVALSSVERASPLLEAITRSILFVLVIDNDLYSHSKERGASLAYGNIIDVLRLTRSEQNPFGQAIALRNQSLQCYVALKAQYRSRHGNALHSYFQGLEDIISGNLVFGSTNARYATQDSPQFLGGTNPDHFRPQSPQYEVVDSWDEPIIPPRDIPSIAGWWSLL